MFYQEQFQLLLPQTGHKVRGNFKRKPKNKNASHANYLNVMYRILQILSQALLL